MYEPNYNASNIYGAVKGTSLNFHINHLINIYYFLNSDDEKLRHGYLFKILQLIDDKGDDDE